MGSAAPWDAGSAGSISTGEDPWSTSQRQRVEELSISVETTPRRVEHHATCVTPRALHTRDPGLVSMI